jgi:carboxyl-terminal processing protease
MKKKIIILIIFVLFLNLSCENILIGPDSENTPENIFDELWTEFDLYYALFEANKIDWNSLYATYRPMVNKNTSDDELWKIITDMLSKLNDVHIFMTNKAYNKYYVGGSLENRKMGDFSLNLVLTKYLKSNYKTAGEGNLYYGSFPNNETGYIYIATFSGGNNSWSKDIFKAVSELSNMKSIIVDLRDNGGGSTTNYQNCASAFIDRKITYLQWRARTGKSHSDFENSYTLSVEPDPDKFQFTKKIVLLTNRFSGSSSEHFALIFKHLPYSIQVGDTTAGGFGSVTKESQLSNGWVYHFTGRFATTLDGKVYDGIGIIPDIYKINTVDDIKKQTDKVLEYALGYLQ